MDKKIMMSLAFICFCILGNAQPKQTETPVKDATLAHANVYFGYGAELKHEAIVKLNGGAQEIILSNLSTKPDQNTIQVACPDNVTLLSYNFKVAPIEIIVAPDPAIKKLADSITMLKKQVATFNNEYAIEDDILNRTAKLIEANLTNSNKKEISSEELIKLVEYYTTKIQKIKVSLYAISLKRNEVNEKINGIQERINEMKPPVQKKTYIGQLVLKVMTNVASNANFSVSYFTRNAGWAPTYDIRVKSIDNSLKIVYKASVSQTTGLDWKNVRLSLSTRNPNQSGVAPKLNPWFVQLYAPDIYETLTNRAYNAPLRNMQGLASVDIKKDKFDDGEQYVFQEKLENVETGSVQQFTGLSESQLNTNFDIDLPYDIPTDGQAYNVAIKDEMVNATYKHVAIPKLDKDAFLLANISDWEKLDLLPGNANIIMDNIYLGQTTIDPNSITDTLSLSLGRDKRISTSRTLVKEFTKTKVRGDTKLETFTYEITVKNNKKQAVDMLLRDQFPISKLKEVEVELEDAGNADVNKETGLLSWNLKLQPGESKTIRFGYSIKYPKDKRLQNSR